MDLFYISQAYLNFGFKHWKQPLPEMQGKVVYNTPLWWSPSPNFVHSESFSTPDFPLSKFGKATDSHWRNYSGCHLKSE